jgi:hypothetical protein
MQVQSSGLTNMQMELIKMFNYNLPEKQLLEIKQILVKYFADKVSDQADLLWKENNWTNDTMNSLLNESQRTKYE